MFILVIVLKRVDDRSRQQAIAKKLLKRESWIKGRRKRKGKAVLAVRVILIPRVKLRRIMVNRES